MNLVWPDTLIEIAIISLLALLTRGLLKRLIKQWVTRAAAQAVILLGFLTVMGIVGWLENLGH